MYYFAHIALRGFYAAVHRGNQWTDAKPLVIHRDKSVLDLNLAARQLGILEGMSLREAKTMIGDSSCLVAWEPSTYNIKHQRWLDCVCEHVNEVESRDQHEVFLDLSGQPDPADLACQIANRLQGFDFGFVELGVGASKWIARLAAMPIGDPLDEFPVSSPAGFLALRKVEDLLPVSPEHRRRLRFLGYRTIGEVAAIPSRALKAQFGEESSRILLAAKGEWQEPFQPNYPIDTAFARIENPEGWSDWNQLSRAYSQLAVRLRTTLRRLDACTRSMNIDFTFESGEWHGRGHLFPKPLHTAKDLHRAMSVLTPKIHEPIVEVVVRLEKLERIVRKQKQLDGTNELNERKLSAEQAFHSIRTVFGDKAIQTASEMEIPRRTRVIRAWKDATGWN